jgi:hypothetical protein
MSLTAYVLIGIALVLFLLPPRWDPAIRIKERQIHNGTHPEAIDRSHYACSHADHPDEVCGQCGRGCNR